LAGQEDRLRLLVTAQPDRTLAELRDTLPTTAGLATIWRALGRWQFTVKTYTPTNNIVLMSRRRIASGTTPSRCAICGSTSFSMSVASPLRRYGRSPRGTRLQDHTPCRHWQTHTVIAALRPDGLSAPALFDGPLDTPTFRADVDRVLVLTLRPGDGVVLAAPTTCGTPAIGSLYPYEKRSNAGL
jgi:hypothetical protein